MTPGATRVPAAQCPTPRDTRWVTMDDGAELRVLEYGPAHGPRLVFLPGWLSIPRNWNEVLSVLVADYCVLYCESREKASARLDPAELRDFSVPRLTADLATLVDVLVGENTPYDLAGSSLGATVILEYLASGRRAPQRCALIAPNREFRFPRWLQLVIPLLPLWIYPAFRAYIKFHLRHFRLDPAREPEQYAKYCETVDLADPAKLKPNAISLMRYQLTPAVRGIGTETLILGGAADRLHGLEGLQALTDEIPGARLLAMASNKATHSRKAGLLMLDFLRGGFPALPLPPPEERTSD